MQCSVYVEMRVKRSSGVCGGRANGVIAVRWRSMVARRMSAERSAAARSSGSPDKLAGNVLNTVAFHLSASSTNPRSACSSSAAYPSAKPCCRTASSTTSRSAHSSSA
eukprot:5761544-Prymnesium_polylepis.2